MTSGHYDNDMLTRLRVSAEMTQEQVAQKVGVKRLTIIRAEGGLVASYKLLGRMARLYGVPLTSLLHPHPTDESLTLAKK